MEIFMKNIAPFLIIKLNFLILFVTFQLTYSKIPGISWAQCIQHYESIFSFQGYHPNNVKVQPFGYEFSKTYDTTMNGKSIGFLTFQNKTVIDPPLIESSCIQNLYSSNFFISPQIYCLNGRIGDFYTNYFTTYHLGSKILDHVIAIDGLPLTSRQSALHMNNQIFTFGGYVDHKNTIDSNNINIINPISKKLMKSVGPKNSSISPNARASSCFLPYSADDKEFSEESFSSTSPEKTPPIIMLFGESSKDGIITRHNDVWLAKILVNEVEWVRIYPKPDKLTGLSPNPTTLNSCVRHAFMGTNTVFFFGGITTINDNETRLTNSIWSLSQNRDSLEWRWQLITTHDANLSNSNDLVPTSRATSIFNIENMQLLIYGGFTDLNNMYSAESNPKLYIFDLCAMKWVERVNRNYDRMDCPEKISVFLVVTTALILIFAVLVILFISKKFRKSQFLEKFIMDINSGNPENKNNWKYYILKNRYFKKLATVFKISSISTSKKLVSDRIHKGHIPQHDDQIIVNVGDIFEIREIYLDDWVFGFNVNTSKEGIIPLNCLENLNPLDYPEILNNKRYKPLVHGLDQLGNNHNEDFNSYEAQLRQRQSQRISFPPNYAEIQNDNIATD